jgi:hypothetical protein
MMRPPRSPSDRRALLLALACGALTACGGHAYPHPTEPVIGCDSTTVDMPLANLGPDLTLRVLCRAGARGAIASVDEPGPGLTPWRVSLAGDDNFSLEAATFATCNATGATVAFVDLQPAFGDVPGDTYEAVATISADHGTFPTTKVALHGEVVAPNVTAPSLVDFGEVPAWQPQTRTLEFNNASPSPVGISPAAGDFAPFTLSFAATRAAHPQNVTSWTISLDAAAPGDYDIPVLWTATPSPALIFPPACLWTQTITLHAHVVGDPDGGPRDANRDGAAGDGALPLTIP